MAEGLVINSESYASGEPYNGSYDFMSDFTGKYDVLYTWLADGNIPICYTGINDLIIRNSDTLTTANISFGLLESDLPDDVNQWFTDALGSLSLDGISYVSASFDSDTNEYTLNFSDSVDFLLAGSSISAIFHSENLSGSSIVLSGYHLNSRPKFIGLEIIQATPLYNTFALSNICIIITTKDDQIQGAQVRFASSQSSLNIKIHRLNAPGVVCPLTLPFAIFLRKNN